MIRSKSMKKRIFLWGLSNGILALTIAALFWIGMGLGPSAGKVEWYVDALLMLVVYGSCGLCIWGALRLRKRSGFTRSDLRPSDPAQRAENRTIVHRFGLVVVVQAILVAAAVVCSLRFADQEVMWSLIALVISLHFIPLGRIFRVPPYYVVGVAGSVVAVSSFASIVALYRVMYLGVALGVVMLGSAGYLLWKAEELALHATGESP
jgi:hypothetical protein